MWLNIALYGLPEAHRPMRDLRSRACVLVFFVVVLETLDSVDNVVYGDRRKYLHVCLWRSPKRTISALTCIESTVVTLCRDTTPPKTAATATSRLDAAGQLPGRCCSC